MFSVLLWNNISNIYALGFQKKHIGLSPNPLIFVSAHFNATQLSWIFSRWLLFLMHNSGFQTFAKSFSVLEYRESFESK